MQTIHCRKNAWSSDVDGTCNQTTCNDNSLSSNQPHYYGSIKSISNDDDVSYIRRGSVYYLPDYPKGPNTTYHPYIVIQSTYLDKIGKISVFGITSCPTYINMIPIAMRSKRHQQSTIGYIDPHQPYVYRVDDFLDPNSKYIASIVNEEVIDLACDMYGMHLGMNLARSNTEIIRAYREYVEEFKARATNFKPYIHRKMVPRQPNDLLLHISFGEYEMYEDFEGDDECDDEVNNLNTIYEDNDEQTAEQLPTIIVDLSSDQLMTDLIAMENAKVGEFTLPRNVSSMTQHEIIVFLACKSLKGTTETALLYSTSDVTIRRKFNQLNAMYNITYQD